MNTKKILIIIVILVICIIVSIYTNRPLYENMINEENIVGKENEDYNEKKYSEELLKSLEKIAHNKESCNKNEESISIIEIIKKITSKIVSDKVKEQEDNINKAMSSKKDKNATSETENANKMLQDFTI